MRALRHHVRQHRRGAPGGGGRSFAARDAEQGAGGALGGLALVDMRIGLVAGDDLRVVHHRGENIGVHVVGDAERRVRVDGADAGEKFALAVVEALGDHGAVQVQLMRRSRPGLPRR